jgi:hypothetical protein
MSKIPDYLLQKSYDQTTPIAIKRRLEKLQKENALKYQSKHEYRFRPANLPDRVDGLDRAINPEKYAVRTQTDQQQIQELLRLAKITAKTARMNRDDTGYENEKKRFMQSFSIMISKYNLNGQINTIFLP